MVVLSGEAPWALVPPCHKADGCCPAPRCSWGSGLFLGTMLSPTLVSPSRAGRGAPLRKQAALGRGRSPGHARPVPVRVLPEAQVLAAGPQDGPQCCRVSSAVSQGCCDEGHRPRACTGSCPPWFCKPECPLPQGHAQAPSCRPALAADPQPVVTLACSCHPCLLPVFVVPVVSP